MISKHTLSRRFALMTLALSFVASVVVLGSCEIPVATPSDPHQIVQVIVVPESISLDPTQQMTFAAYGRTTSGDSSAVTVSWSATGGSITPDGMFAADTAAGDFLVLGTSAALNLSTSSWVRIRQRPVATVRVSPASASMTAGQTVQLTATLRDAYGNVLSDRVVTWASSDAGLATVSGSGLVTGMAAGSATITATSEGKSGTSAVTVTPVPVASVSVSPASANVTAGQTVQLTATPRDANGNALTGRVVTWASSNTAVATVSGSGLVTGVGAGPATIAATSGGKSGTAAITVTPPPVPVASVSVSPASANVTAGQNVQLTATPRDASGNVLVGRVVTWASSDAGLAMVSGNGLVTGVGAGSATITATSEGKNGTAAITVTPVPVASVSVSPASANVTVGLTVQLTATPRDASGNALVGRVVTWASSDAGLATVSSSGLVMGVGAGSATITATSEGKDGTAALTVTPIPVPVASVSVSPASPNVTTGQTVQLTATPQDANGNALSGRVVTWASSNSGVATVSSSGLVTGVAAGSATITATSEGQSGTSAVTVTLAPVASVSVSPASANLTVGLTVQLIATPRDASGNALVGRVVTWASSDAGLATVSGSGLVTGVAVGSATITATSEGQSSTSAVTVTPVPVASVSVNPASTSVTAGQTVQLTATPRDASGSALTDRVVTWTTSNAGIATVSGSGLVMGVAAGSATITATSEGKSGTAAVTVTPMPVASVSVTPASPTVATGQKVQLTATPRDAAGNALAGRVVTWASNNTAVATVNGSGLVTGVSAGSATITATCEGKNGTAAVTVTLAPVASVSVSPASASVPAGQTVQLTATLRDASGNVLLGRVVTWGSSNTGVATVNGSGLVTGIAIGLATITATCEGKSGTAGVSVPPVTSSVAFPLHVDAGKRYLIDAQGNPFLLQGDAPWSLIVQLTNEQAEQYLEDRRQKGFNTVLVNLIEHQFAANPPKNVYGDAPFLTPGDFSTPNEAYFAHAAYVINLAAQKGILVLLAPAYMGVGGGSEGWYQEMVANGTTKLSNYGTYVANRFRAYDNIVWVEGGDFNPDLNILRAIPNAIRAVDPKWLHTFHGSSGTDALAFLPSEPWLQVNDIYTYTDLVGHAFQEYGRSSMPFFLIESRYEGEGASEAQVRQQAYQVVLSGGTGQIMGNRPIWLFDTGWQTALSSRGARTLSFLPALLAGRSWWTLAPDIAHTVLTAGVSSGADQAVTARAGDGSFVLAYLPSARPVTVNLAQLSGPNVVARWYDPASGTYATVAGSPFASASGAHIFTPAATNSSGFSDWVLVLESSP